NNSVIHCPATSSITTNEGSSMPALLETRVAAGIPRTTATKISAPKTSGCHLGGVMSAAISQTRIAQSEPQEPGAGWIRPAPKNVATARAHNGAGVLAAS